MDRRIGAPAFAMIACGIVLLILVALPLFALRDPTYSCVTSPLDLPDGVQIENGVSGRISLMPPGLECTVTRDDGLPYVVSPSPWNYALPAIPLGLIVGGVWLWLVEVKDRGAQAARREASVDA